jgi:4'-phosphopantetheinyl transferase EntD
VPSLWFNNRYAGTPTAAGNFPNFQLYGLMTIVKGPSLAGALEDIAMPGVLIDHRTITDGDEFGLFPEERGAFARSVVRVRRASGAARIVARGLMQRFGIAPQPVLKTTAGMPQWPDGIVGSLAHDSTVAVAALARRADFFSIGVDLEPAEGLDADLLPLIATERERKDIENSPLQGRLLFAVKEAIYKAVYPLDGTFLDHHDVEVNLTTRTAAVRRGRTVPFRFSLSSHIAVLAFIAADASERTGELQDLHSGTPS